MDAVENGEELSPALGEKEDDTITEFLEEFLGAIMTATDAAEPDRYIVHILVRTSYGIWIKEAEALNQYDFSY